MSGEDTEHIAELFSAYGRVSVRRMFSGAGVFDDGLMIALAVKGVIFLKADQHTIAEFEREGLGPFCYQTKGGTHTLKFYWRMPERLYDDADELAVWARRAMQAARRGGARSSAKSGNKSKKKR